LAQSKALAMKSSGNGIDEGLKWNDQPGDYYGTDDFDNTWHVNNAGDYEYQSFTGWSWYTLNEGSEHYGWKDGQQTYYNRYGYYQHRNYKAGDPNYGEYFKSGNDGTERHGYNEDAMIPETRTYFSDGEMPIYDYQTITDKNTD